MRSCVGCRAPPRMTVLQVTAGDPFPLLRYPETHIPGTLRFCERRCIPALWVPFGAFRLLFVCAREPIEIIKRLFDNRRIRVPSKPLAQTCFSQGLRRNQSAQELSALRSLCLL
jgi:hypothetical protein